MNSPTGTITFLFTDIEGSTRLWESHPETMRLALARHDVLMREAVTAHNGYIFKTLGDAFCVAFYTAGDAAGAASEAQERLHREEWPEATPIRVRMALATGSVESRDNDYFGLAVNRVARLMSAGNGGQILVATTTRDLLPPSLPLTDLGIHRLKDIPQPERIYLLPYPGMPSELPPLRTLTTSVHNQPQQLTRFVGREQEIEEWSRLIQSRSRRLFTITGFGGVGKTRIAMQIGEKVLHAFPDSAWWCGLEETATAEEAINQIAMVFGVPLQPSPSVKEQLFGYLRERSALLILDNLEQVSGGPGLLKELLAETREIVCLITSRRTMELRGETVLDLSPMPTADSVTLFRERASECRPDFLIDEENHADVLELCRRLEGIPLAIELAAVRITVMTPRQILQRLTERFRLLQSRSQELSERQRALRGAIDWSYALLTEEDKQVFIQLSVFAGGFTLENAEAVCETFDLFENVMSLRQQSLFRVETIPDTQQQRFLMLDSLREYAAEKLQETEDAGAAIRRRHADYFLRFAQTRLDRLRTPDEASALEALEESKHNLRAALEWAMAQGDLSRQAELALVSGIRLQRRGFMQGAVEIIQSGLEAARRGGESCLGVAARLMLERAGLHYDFGEATECEQCAGEALTIFAQSGDKKGVAKAENLLGQAAMLGEQFTPAISHYQRALELFEQIGDTIGIANTWNNLGLAERRNQSGSPEEIAERQQHAAVHFNNALQFRRKLNDQRGLAETFTNLGVLAFERDQFAEAWTNYRQALTYERQIDNRHGIGVSLFNLGEVACKKLGNRAQGIHLLLASERALLEVGSPSTEKPRKMLEEESVAAGWNAAQLAEGRASLQTLTVDECCDWALTPVSDSLETV